MGSKHILLIDDTLEFSAGLERLLNSMGHLTRSCSDLEQAKQMVSTQDFDLIFVDCFMPMHDGFQVSKELAKILKAKKSETKMIMMSGIIVDEKSQKEALSKSYISHFLVKPISKDRLEECVGTVKASPQNSSFFCKLSQIEKAQDLESLLNAKKKINGIELAFLVTAISKFELSCNIDISDSETAKSFSISIHSGSLDRITSSEYSNALGELLVRLGYLSNDDLSSYINSPEFKTNQTPIGLALTNLNLLSPHAVPIALQQQIRNRLSDLFIIKKFDFTFSALAPKPSDGFCSLDLYDLRVASSNFLKSEKADSFLSDIAPCIKSVTLAESKTEKVASGTTLPELNSGTYSNEDLKIIMSNIVLEVLIVEPIDFSEENSVTLAKQHILDMISNIQFRAKSGNPYDLLDITVRGSSDQKISKAYQEIAKVLHPDKVSKVLDKKDLSLADATFNRVSEAFNLIKTADNRKTYESAQKNHSTQIKLHCNNILEAAKSLLSRGEYTKAFESLNTKEMHEHEPNEFGLYLLWSAIKTKNTVSLKKTVSNIFEEEKKDLSNEALYFYLKGLHALENGDNGGFTKYISQSLKADPKFLPARREIQIAKNKVAQQKSASAKASWFSFKKSS